MKMTNRFITLSFSTLLFGIFSMTALASNTWQNRHANPDEVKQQQKNKDKPIDGRLREGKINKEEARKLRHKGHHISKQADASLHQEEKKFPQ